MNLLHTFRVAVAMRCRTYARMSCRMSPISTFRLELSAPNAPARPDTRASTIRPPAVFLVALRARKDKTVSQFLRNKAAAARWDTPSQRGRRGNDIERDFRKGERGRRRHHRETQHTGRVGQCNLQGATRGQILTRMHKDQLTKLREGSWPPPAFQDGVRFF